MTGVWVTAQTHLRTGCPIRRCKLPTAPPLMALKAEIAFDCIKLTPERRMDEIELLIELGEDETSFPEGSRPEARVFKTEPSLHLK